MQWELMNNGIQKWLQSKVANAINTQIVLFDALAVYPNLSHLSFLSTPRRVTTPRQSLTQYNCWKCNSSYRSAMEYLAHIQGCGSENAVIL